MSEKKYKPILIALTGNLGSGKSTVAEMFKEHGAYIIDADLLARQVTEPGEPAYKDIVDLFGEQIVEKDQQLNRRNIAELIFKDQKLKTELEGIMHPRIRELFETELENVSNQYNLIVYVIPLLFETGFDPERFDYTVSVIADKETCIGRVIKRSKYSRELAEQIFDSQIEPELKKKFSSHFIENNSDIETLRANTEDLIKKISS